MDQKTYDQAYAVIAQLTELEVPGGRVSQELGERIAAMFAGDVSAFTMLDSQSGRFPDPYDWHWKLRQARNNTAGFFDLLAAGARA